MEARHALKPTLQAQLANWFCVTAKITCRNKGINFVGILCTHKLGLAPTGQLV